MKDILKESRILIVDDEEILSWSIETELKSHGADVQSTGSIRTGIEAFHRFNPDLCICDLRLPDGSGLELLKKWRHEKVDIPIILITAHGAIESAIDALRLGAFDYLQKPFDMKSLVASVKRGMELSLLRQKINRLTGHESPREPLEIIGDSLAMSKVKQILRRIAQSKSSTVMILGESGTGKELAARAVHEWSEFAGQPFVEINCASIPENLLESELFGYEKGAFTDARDRKLGLFEMAQSGTIFLDEIGEMPLNLQSKLLRALESRRFKRLGGTKDIRFNARVIVATNRDLLSEIRDKRFRADLFYRINSLPVTLPPLRLRLTDIDALCQFFLKKLSEELQVKPTRISQEAIAKLKSHDWPGNVRELKNALERAMVFHQPEEIMPSHLTFDAPLDELPTTFQAQEKLNGYSRYLSENDVSSLYHEVNGDNRYAHANLNHSWSLPEEGINLEGLEKSLLIQALEKARNNQTKAAALLGISRHTFRYRLEKYGILNH